MEDELQQIRPVEMQFRYSDFKKQIIQTQKAKDLCPNAKFIISIEPEVILSILSYDKQIKVIYEDGYYNKQRTFVVTSQNDNPITYQQVINKLIEKELNPCGDHIYLESIDKKEDGLYYLWFGS